MPVKSRLRYAVRETLVITAIFNHFEQLPVELNITWHLSSHDPLKYKAWKLTRFLRCSLPFANYTMPPPQAAPFSPVGPVVMWLSSVARSPLLARGKSDTIGERALRGGVISRRDAFSTQPTFDPRVTRIAITLLISLASYSLAIARP